MNRAVVRLNIAMAIKTLIQKKKTHRRYFEVIVSLDLL